MKDLYSRVPVNKTAALVTNQSGCEKPESETILEAIERLKSQLQWVKKARKARQKGSKKYISLGKEIHEINRELQLLYKRKGGKHDKERGLAEYINCICKQKFNKFEWARIIALAKQEKARNDKSLWVNKK